MSSRSESTPSRFAATWARRAAVAGKPVLVVKLRGRTEAARTMAVLAYREPCPVPTRLSTRCAGRRCHARWTNPPATAPSPRARWRGDLVACIMGWRGWSAQAAGAGSGHVLTEAGATLLAWDEARVRRASGNTSCRSIAQSDSTPGADAGPARATCVHETIVPSMRIGRVGAYHFIPFTPQPQTP